ncbi:MAG TPA: integrase family protein [Stellaceae bacterium]|nr:integrase family protein [Stellaceae bacterium]
MVESKRPAEGSQPALARRGKVQALADRAGSDGERDAAVAALSRIDATTQVVSLSASKTLGARKFTALWVANVKPDPSGRVTIADKVMPGFALRLTPEGVKSFSYRYRFGGQQRRATWRYPAVSLAEAWAKAAAIDRALSAGEDPDAARLAPENAGATLAAVAELWFSDYLRANRLRTAAEWEQIIRRDLLNGTAKLGRRAASSITEADLVRVLDHVRKRAQSAAKQRELNRAALWGRDPDPREWEQGGVGANRIATVLKMFFTWAARKRRIPVNPAAELDMPVVEAGRAQNRALSDAELAAVWRLAPGVHAAFGDIVRLLILTGCRRDEIAMMQRGEYAVDTGELTVEGSRTKNGLTLLLPLPQLARAIIAGQDEIEGCLFVFSTNGKSAPSGFSKWQRALNQKLAAERGELSPEEQAVFFAKPWTLHCLRHSLSTGSTGMRRLGVQPHIVESVLNHRSSLFRGVAGRYDHHDYKTEKAEALAAWATHVREVTQPRRGRADQQQHAGAAAEATA